jgi:hypothetical protein
MQNSTITLVPSSNTSTAHSDENHNNNTNNNNGHTTKSSKEQACKRVGSLKVDVKKIKSNIMRSKR